MDSNHQPSDYWCLDCKWAWPSASNALFSGFPLVALSPFETSDSIRVDDRDSVGLQLATNCVHSPRKTQMILTVLGGSKPFEVVVLGDLSGGPNILDRGLKRW